MRTPLVLLAILNRACAPITQEMLAWGWSSSPAPSRLIGASLVMAHDKAIISFKASLPASVVPAASTCPAPCTTTECDNYPAIVLLKHIRKRSATALVV